jgi:nitroimidazol reductase NimA-like FMN-containing flavoprotein (pyridoxamine 5'-phosphate oxidase superfamily)
MRAMTEKEIRDFIEEWTWGTLIAVDGDKPYAVEVTYASDGKYIHCGSMPGGRMARCVKKNPNVVFKICNSDKSYRTWKAVIIEGKAERLTKREDILASVRLLAKKMGLGEEQLDHLAERIAAEPDGANSLKIPIKTIGGRCTP